jgi:hypothetical protein
LSDLDEADGPMEGKRVLVTGDSDRAMARAAGVVALIGYQTYGEAIDRDRDLAQS